MSQPRPALKPNPPQFIQVPTTSLKPIEEEIVLSQTQKIISIIFMICIALGAIHYAIDRWQTRPSERIVSAPPPRIPINRASRTELLQLPGVGPSLADHLLTHRQLNGPFRSWEDLKQVPGVGDATLKRLQDRLILDEPDLTLDPDQEPQLLQLERKIDSPSKPIIHTTNKPNLTGLICINTASVDELQALPGIGPVLAKRIVEVRREKPFVKIEDLRRVSGIGLKRMEQLKDKISFD